MTFAQGWNWLTIHFHSMLPSLSNAWQYVFLFNVFNYIYLCMCMSGLRGIWHSVPFPWRSELAGVSSLLLYGTWGLNLGWQAWWQAPSCMEPSHQPSKINSYRRLFICFSAFITINSNDEKKSFNRCFPRSLVCTRHKYWGVVVRYFLLTRNRKQTISF